MRPTSVIRYAALRTTMTGGRRRPIAGVREQRGAWSLEVGANDDLHPGQA